MSLQKILPPLACVLLLAAASHFYGWAGVALALGALVMWLLLHFTRLLQVLRRAAQRPIGHVDSAVMLHAKLQPGMSLLHVVALTRALGELRSAPGGQPECYRWSDASQSQVNCEFRDGKLQQWTLVRPAQNDAATPDSSVAPAP